MHAELSAQNEKHMSTFTADIKPLCFQATPPFHKSLSLAFCLEMRAAAVVKVG